MSDDMAVVDRDELQALARPASRSARLQRHKPDVLERLVAEAVRRGYGTPERLLAAVMEDERQFRDPGAHPGERLIRSGALGATEVASLLGARAPGYRLLEDSLRLATLLKCSLSQATRSVLVAGLSSRSGSAAVLAGLGVATMLTTGRRTVLVDCDTAQPSLHEQFDVPQRVGEPCRTGLPGLLVVPCGGLAAPATTLIDPPTLRQIVLAGGEEGLALVSAPPLLGNALTLTLASHTDAVVLVAPAKGCRRSELAEARRLLGQVGATVVGIVTTRDGR